MMTAKLWYEAKSTSEGVDGIIAMGEALKTVGETLKQLPDDESRRRVLKAVAALYGLELI